MVYNTQYMGCYLAGYYFLFISFLMCGVCTRSCGYVYMYIYDYVGGSSCMWRPGVNIMCLPQLLTTSFFETGSLTRLELTDSARLAGQQGPGILLSPPL